MKKNFALFSLILIGSSISPILLAMDDGSEYFPSDKTPFIKNKFEKFKKLETETKNLQDKMLEKARSEKQQKNDTRIIIATPSKLWQQLNNLTILNRQLNEKHLKNLIETKKIKDQIEKNEKNLEFDRLYYMALSRMPIKDQIDVDRSYKFEWAVKTAVGTNRFCQVSQLKKKDCTIL